MEKRFRPLVWDTSTGHGQKRKKRWAKIGDFFMVDFQQTWWSTVAPKAKRRKKRRRERGPGLTSGSDNVCSPNFW